MNTIGAILFCLAILLSASCSERDKTLEYQSNTSITDCGCDSLWAASAAKEFVSVLAEATGTDHLVWPGYRLGDASYVLNAGQPDDSTYCLGLWRQGEPLSYLCARDVPNMLTPLYSYYLNYEQPSEIDSKYVETYQNAPDFTAWMNQHQIETAVYMPTDFPKFPFKIPAKTKVQLAIHEAFHIEVMLRKWYTGQGFWPSWDQQPDRLGVQNCYTLNESAQDLIEKEQELLALLIESLLDHKSADAIRLAEEFIGTRQRRFDLLKDVKVQLHDGEYGSCADAEALMEIEEGIADYASWVIMYDIDIADRTELLRRYRAQQKDLFYLTGCMLLHASLLMNEGGDQEIISKLVTAPSLMDGNLFQIFQYKLESYRKMK